MEEPKYGINDRFVIRDCLIVSSLCDECSKLYFYRAYSGNMLDFYYCISCQECNHE